MKSKFEKREEAIFGSFDGIQPAEVPPYFYTRLLVRMQNELEVRKPTFILLRPAFLTASLSVILAVNIAFLFQFNNQQRPSAPQSNNTATIESFADAYNLNGSSVYE